MKLESIGVATPTVSPSAMRWVKKIPPKSLIQQSLFLARYLITLGIEQPPLGIFGERVMLAKAALPRALLAPTPIFAAPMPCVPL